MLLTKHGRRLSYALSEEWRYTCQSFYFEHAMTATHFAFGEIFEIPYAQLAYGFLGNFRNLISFRSLSSRPYIW